MINGAEIGAQLAAAAERTDNLNNMRRGGNLGMAFLAEAVSQLAGSLRALALKGEDAPRPSSPIVEALRAELEHIQALEAENKVGMASSIAEANKRAQEYALALVGPVNAPPTGNVAGDGVIPAAVAVPRGLLTDVDSLLSALVHRHWAVMEASGEYEDLIELADRVRAAANGMKR